MRGGVGFVGNANRGSCEGDATGSPGFTALTVETGRAGSGGFGISAKKRRAMCPPLLVSYSTSGQVMDGC